MEIKTEVTGAKRDMWLKKCGEIDSLMGETKSKEAWKMISDTRQNTQEKCGITLINKNKWKTYYRRTDRYTEQTIPILTK